MAETIRITAEKIRKLQVQGARNVAIAAVKAIQTQAEQTTAKTKIQFLNELKEAQTIFVASRETEPLMRNAIRWIITQAQSAKTEKVETLSQNVVANANQFLKDLEDSKEQIAEIGAKPYPRWLSSFYPLPLINCNSPSCQSQGRRQKLQSHLHRDTSCLSGKNNRQRTRGFGN